MLSLNNFWQKFLNRPHFKKLLTHAMSVMRRGTGCKLLECTFVHSCVHSSIQWHSSVHPSIRTYAPPPALQKNALDTMFKISISLKFTHDLHSMLLPTVALSRPKTHPDHINTPGRCQGSAEWCRERSFSRLSVKWVFL